jgi:hypothetical protein
LIVPVDVVKWPPAIDFFADVALLKNFGPARQLVAGQVLIAIGI